MKTSDQLNWNVERHFLINRVSQLRSSLYLIAHGELSQDSARREAKRAMALDDKMKETHEPTN
jgi:hypothetical protein